MGKERLHNIEILRGLAALAVTWFHLTNTYPLGIARASGALGWLGVDCFFVISGFVIPYALHQADYESRNFWRFIARRLVRLEPPYIASIMLTVALAFASAATPGFAGNAPNFSAPQLGAHLFYLIPLTHFGWAQPVYWSLAYEFAFYIAMGLAFSTIWKQSLWWTALISGLVFCAGFAITRQWDARLLLFLFGIAGVRRFVGKDSTQTFLVCIAANAALIAIAGAPLSAGVGIMTALLLVFARLPSIPVLTWLGAISYSLYLIHVPIGGRVVNLGGRFLHGDAWDLLLSLTALAMALGFAWTFHKAVEAGATKLAKRIAIGSPVRTSPAITD